MPGGPFFSLLKLWKLSKIEPEKISTDSPLKNGSELPKRSYKNIWAMKKGPLEY